MFTNPTTDAVLQLDLTRDALLGLKAAIPDADGNPQLLAFIDDQVRWHEAQEDVDVRNLELLQARCRHVWVPAGLNPHDSRVCARCNTER